MLLIIKKNFINKTIFIWYSSEKIQEKYYNTIIFIKFFIIIIIFYLLFYFRHIYINIKEIKKIEIDNQFEALLYEKNINFSNYKTEIKPVALYYIESIIYNNKYFPNLINNLNISIKEIIKEQVNLAKNHGIYGFAIDYMLYNDNKSYNEIVDIFLNDKDINFPFFLIWNNDNYSNIFYNLEGDDINILKLIENKIDEFIKTIKKHLISQIYIKINDKAVISINKPLLFPNLNETLFILREKAREFGIGELFIISPLTQKFNDSKYLKLFDAAYDLSKIDLLNNNINIKNISYYSGIIYKNLIINNYNNQFSLFRTSLLEIYNDLKKIVLKDYTLEKYYILNNIIIEWTKINLNRTKGFIFINSWNNYREGNYLEPDKKYGYSSIKCFSKALFNIPFKNNNYNLINLNDKCVIAIQAHVYYEDLIYEVISKTNNIPIKFDLFISTISVIKKKQLRNISKNIQIVINMKLKLLRIKEEIFYHL